MELFYENFIIADWLAYLSGFIFWKINSSRLWLLAIVDNIALYT